MRAYILKRSKRSHNISIRIGNNNAVHVTAPDLVPKILVDQFVKRQDEWIDKQQQKQAKKTKIVDKKSIHLFGKTYQKKTTYNPQQETGFSILNGALLYNNALQQTSLNSDKYEVALVRFLKQTAEQYLLPKTYALAKLMDVSVARITLREQRSRWGSCSSRGNINFNWRLVHFSPQSINYVIIHELAHLTHHNHSRTFWALVAKYAPNYKLAKRELQKFAIPLA
ncbi:MAG: M48 family metallopeptidase [Candidatus Pacebacteria bacterium]|nr:M48 family metallopeptidase [Candidatus Paceibacterota bacterium]PIR60162.1 MAG: hypothetical protein COU67_03180 [Candidatus Pacebacteria bacterium CG10_big_fil_rev_8_21_14_0_10_44_54]